MSLWRASIIAGNSLTLLQQQVCPPFLPKLFFLQGLLCTRATFARAWGCMEWVALNWRIATLIKKL